MHASCSRCRHWRRIHREGDVGRCHRYPPELSDIGLTVSPLPQLVVLHDWPLTVANDHCGEYRTAAVGDGYSIHPILN